LEAIFRGLLESIDKTHPETVLYEMNINKPYDKPISVPNETRRKEKHTEIVSMIPKRF